MKARECRRTHPSFRALPWRLAASALVLCPAAVLGVTLNGDLYTADYDYNIQFYNIDNSKTEWFTSTASAWDVADMFDRAGGISSEGNPRGLHIGYIDLGFETPDFIAEIGSDRDVKLTKDDAPNANRDRIVIPPLIISNLGSTSAELLQICGHELFHNIQYGYVGHGSYFQSLKPFATEGTAEAMKDSIYDAADGDEYDTGWEWMAWASEYLEDYTDLYLWDVNADGNGYLACLFWHYLMEQFGSDRTEPHTGHDVIEEFWELARDNGLGIYSTIEDVLDAKDRSTTSETDRGVAIEEVYQDFTIANWVRRYINPWVSGYSLDVDDPERFYYVDENIAPTVFYNDNPNSDPSDDDPSATTTHTLSPGTKTSLQNQSVQKWSAEYYVCELNNIAPGPAGYGVGFWAESDSAEACWYSLIGIRDSGSIDLIVTGSVEVGAGNTFQYVTMQSGSDPYERLIAVASGYLGESQGGLTDLSPEFSYYFAYFQPTIEIVEPNAEYLAHVGDFADPDRFVVRLKVTSPDYLGSGSVKGLEPDQFTAYVGNAADPADEAEVIAAADVFGEYWLTVQAPAKTADPGGALPLTVRLGTVSDVEETAVIYDFLEVDQMVVIDRSGSMSTTSGGISRIEAARAAAQLFVEASGSDDQIGIVRFSGDGNEPDATAYGDGEVIYPLSNMGTQFERDLVNLMIDETNPGGDMLDPDGWTSIGDGLYWGAKEIVDNGKTDAEKWIVLLSDGHQNEASDFSDQQALLTATGIHVESIALGPGCDEGLLQTIAHETSGKYYKVEADEDSGTGGPRERQSFADEMIYSLADIFLRTAEDIQRRSRIHESSGTLGPGASRLVELEIEEGGLENAVVALFYGTPSTDVALSITDPNGDPVPAPGGGSTDWDPDRHTVYRLPSLWAGTWTFEIENNSAGTIDHLFVVSAKNKQGAHADLYFAQYHGDATYYNQNGLYLVGLPMPVTLVLTDFQGPIRGADVLATVTHPNKDPVVLRLRDDGGSYDGTAGDGVYSAAYTPTTESSPSGAQPDENSPPNLAGSYDVRAEAIGIDNLGRAFERIERGFFQVYVGEQGTVQDTDGDDMPDRYEELHDCLDKSVPDDGGDPDGDGLVSGDEYDRGTNPCSIDTDAGGETDGSEFTFGSNPFDYADDAVMTPPVAGVVQRLTDELSDLPLLEPAQNLIRFSAERGYHQVNLYRTESLGMPFTLVSNIDVSVHQGLYEDEGLANGTRYYYYIEAEDAAGRSSVPSPIFSGTPRGDPVPPMGMLFINDGDRLTDSTSVDLTTVASPDVTQMKIGNEGDFSAAPWQAYSPSVTGHSLGSPSDGDLVEVHVLLRDPAGNVTRIWDTIRYVDTSSSGAFFGSIVLPLDVVNAGCMLPVEGPMTFARATPPSGDFRLVLKPGEYVLRILMRGYEPVELTPMTLNPGDNIDLGVIELVPIDEDNDGLYDVDELLHHETDPTKADTDGDGHEDGEEVNVTLTNPTDPRSVLRIVNVVIQPADGRALVFWTSREGVVYDVLAADSPGDGWTYLGSAPARAEQSTTFFVDPGSLDAEGRVYRIAVPYD